MLERIRSAELAPGTRLGSNSAQAVRGPPVLDAFLNGTALFACGGERLGHGWDGHARRLSISSEPGVRRRAMARHAWSGPRRDLGVATPSSTRVLVSARKPAAVRVPVRCGPQRIAAHDPGGDSRDAGHDAARARAHQGARLPARGAARGLAGRPRAWAQLVEPERYLGLQDLVHQAGQADYGLLVGAGPHHLKGLNGKFRAPGAAGPRPWSATSR